MPSASVPAIVDWPAGLTRRVAYPLPEGIEASVFVPRNTTVYKPFHGFLSFPPPGLVRTAIRSAVQVPSLTWPVIRSGRSLALAWKDNVSGVSWPREIVFAPES